MSLIRILALAAAAALTTGARQSEPTTIIHAATILDGRGGSIKNGYVVVRAGKIDRVSKERVTIVGATTIELGNATLLPGMIDAHTHPGWYVDRNGKRNTARST